MCSLNMNLYRRNLNFIISIKVGRQLRIYDNDLSKIIFFVNNIDI